VIGEGEHGSSRVKANTAVPGSEVRGGFLGQIFLDGIEVEVPVIALIGLDHVVEENIPPLGADDGVPEFVGDDGIGSFYVEVIEQIEATCDFFEGLVVKLVHGA